MKRSDLINEIADFLYENTGCHPVESLAKVEGLFNRIEKMGMIPPKSWIVTNPDNPNYPELQNHKEFVNEWEPEDEL
jgi:hypothetical protein